MKFDMSRAWNEATAMLAANRSVISIVAGVFFFLPYAVFMMLMADRMAALESTAAADPDQAMGAMSAFYSEIWWVILIIAVLQGIGMLGLLALLTDRTRPTVGEALNIGAKCLLPYLGTQLLLSFLLGMVVLVPLLIGGAVSITAGVLVGIAAVVVMIYLFTKFSLAAPVIVKERIFNPIAALGRSWRLTRGSSLRLWLFYFLLIVAIVVVGSVVSIVIGLVFALAGTEAALAGNALVSAALNAVWVTLFLAALAAAHRQLAGDAPVPVGETFD